MKKYKIDYYLERLPKLEYNIVIQALPEYLGVSRRTFDRWKSYKLSSRKEIPVDKMFLIATFFKVQVEDMFRQKPKQITMSELKRHRVSSIASQLGLKK